MGNLISFHKDRTIGTEGSVRKKLFHLLAVVKRYILGILFSFYPAFYQGHTVLGESTGFIRTDNRSAAKSFYCGKTADNRVFLCKALYADGKHDSYYGRQAFGDSGYRKGNRCHKDFQGLKIVNKTYNKYYHAYTNGKESKVFAKFCKLFLKRSLCIPFTAEQGCYFSHFRIHTDCSNNCQSGTIGNAAAGIDHIASVADRCVFVYDSRSVLFRRNGFAGEGGFFALYGCTADKAGVCGNEISCFQLDYIAGHQSGRHYDLFFSVTDNAGMGGGHIFERLQGFFRLAFLHNAQNGVYHNDNEDKGRFEKSFCFTFKYGNNKRYCRRRKKDKYHNILELIKEF